MASKPATSKGAPEGETRLAPDPFTAVLPALAALGAIASIATINWAVQERATSDRARTKRKAGTALRDLEKAVELKPSYREALEPKILEARAKLKA